MKKLLILCAVLSSSAFAEKHNNVGAKSPSDTSYYAATLSLAVPMTA